MPKRSIFLLFCLVLLWGCSTAPRKELQSARMALAQAENADARELAPEDFHRADSVLREGEALVRQGEYDRAREILPQAVTYAREAVVSARRELELRALAREEEAARKRAAADKGKKAAVAKPVLPAPPPLPSPPSAKPAPPPPPPPPPTSYSVGEEESLWVIAARENVYDDPLLWPILYQANRDQIKDPRQVYPGQVLSIPRDLPAGEIEEAREKARRSDIFPLNATPGESASTSPK